MKVENGPHAKRSTVVCYLHLLPLISLNFNVFICKTMTIISHCEAAWKAIITHFVKPSENVISCAYSSKDCNCRDHQLSWPVMDPLFPVHLEGCSASPKHSSSRVWLHLHVQVVSSSPLLAARSTDYWLHLAALIPTRGRSRITPSEKSSCDKQPFQPDILCPLLE